VTINNPEEDKEPTLTPNPEYVAWLAQDRLILSYLMNLLYKEILMHVLRIEHSAGVWAAMEDMFVSQS
jgi:hypothetical protein